MNWRLTHIIPAKVIHDVEKQWAEGTAERGWAALPEGLIVRAQAHNVVYAIPLPRRTFQCAPSNLLPDGSVELVFHFELEVERTIAEEAIRQMTSPQ